MKTNPSMQIVKHAGSVVQLVKAPIILTGIELIRSLTQTGCVSLEMDVRLMLFSLSDAECLVMGEMPVQLSTSGRKTLVNHRNPEGDSQTIDTYHCRNNLTFLHSLIFC